MANYMTDSLSTTFAALSDPTRRAILARLALGETSVKELAQPFSISPPSITKHLKVLEAADLIARERRGAFQIVRLNAHSMRPAEQWIAHYSRFWNTQLDNLETYLEGETKA